MKHSALLLAMVLSISTVASAAPIPQVTGRCQGSDRDWAYWGLQSGLSLAEIAELQKQSNGGKACTPGSETSLPYVQPYYPKPVSNQPPPPVTKPRPKPKADADEEHLPTLPDDEHDRAFNRLTKQGWEPWQAEMIIHEALRQSVGLPPKKLPFSMTKPAKQKPTTTTKGGTRGGTPKVKSPRQEAIDRIVATGVSEKDAAAFVDAQLAKSKGTSTPKTKGTSTPKTKEKPTNTSGMSAADKKALDELEKQKAQFLAAALHAGYTYSQAKRMLADALRQAEAQAKKEGK